MRSIGVRIFFGASVALIGALGAWQPAHGSVADIFLRSRTLEALIRSSPAFHELASVGLGKVLLPGPVTERTYQTWVETVGSQVLRIEDPMSLQAMRALDRIDTGDLERLSQRWMRRGTPELRGSEWAPLAAALDDVWPALRGLTRSWISSQNSARRLNFPGLERIQFALGESSARKAHASIETDLFHGRAVRAEPFSSNGNKNSILRIELTNDRNSRHRTAIFKPRVYGDGGGWNRVPMEYVAYRVNRMLGMDYIPPTAYRYQFAANGQTYAEGALSNFVPDARLLKNVTAEELSTAGVDRRLVLSDHRVLCVVLKNPDGHVKQLLYGSHWVDGSSKPVFVDFAASLQPEFSATLARYTAYGNDAPIYWVRRATYERLKLLNRQGLSELKPFVQDHEIEMILRGRDSILQEVRGLIEIYGEAAVLL